jgi:RND family efflux transporter MFP subunit
MKAIPKSVVKVGVSAACLLAVVAVVAAFALLARAQPPATSGGPGVEPLVVATQPVTWETGYTIERRFVGRVEAQKATDLGFEIAGKVTRVLVEEGDTIALGDAIASLDTERLFAERAELVALRNQAQADFDLAKTTRQRTLDKADRGATTPQELDNVEQAYRAATASLARAKASLDTIDVQLRKSEIVSPYDAVVSKRYVDEGGIVAAGTPVVRLLQRRDPEVRVGIAGDAIDRVEVGQSMTVRIRDREVEGTVSAILPTRASRARLVDVIVRLDAELNGIREGDLARVAITRDIDEAGFWVPVQALTESFRGLWSLYRVETDAKGQRVLKQADVEVLYTLGDRAYIRGALEAGDRYVAEGLHRVSPGMRVRVAEDLDRERTR